MDRKEEDRNGNLSKSENSPLELEVWKEVPFRKTYSVSNMGRVRNNTNGRLLSTNNKKGWYLGVGLGSGVGTGNGRKNFECKPIAIKVHILVMLVFKGPRPSGMNVNHKDGNRGNNKLDNLEYVTFSENSRHAVASGLIKRRGKLREEDVAEIKELLKKGYLHKDIAKKYSVCRPTITNISLGKIWK